MSLPRLETFLCSFDFDGTFTEEKLREKIKEFVAQYKEHQSKFKNIKIRFGIVSSRSLHDLFNTNIHTGANKYEQFREDLFGMVREAEKEFGIGFDFISLPNCCYVKDEKNQFIPEKIYEGDETYSDFNTYFETETNRGLIGTIRESKSTEDKEKAYQQLKDLQLRS